VLSDAQYRVTKARNLLQGDDEEPSAGDTAAVPLRKRFFPKEMMKNQNAGDTTSAQLAANGGSVTASNAWP